MNEPERFVIPGLPISSNQAYRKRGNGPGMYMTAEGKAWKEFAGYYVRQQRTDPLQIWRKKWIKFTMELHMRHPLKQDFDNSLKLTVDIVAKMLDFNDAWIVDPHAPKVWIGKDGVEQIVIAIEEVVFTRRGG